MIRVTGKDGVAHTFSDEKLASVCLNACGGGWTVKQTATAMEVQGRVLETGKAVVKGLKIERV